MQATLQKENEFWRFSLGVYRSLDVAGECLALQEKHSIDVNLLLFCAWIGSSRCATVTEVDIEKARNVVDAWHAQAVRPLRHARQFMKAFADPECQALRTRVKGIELEAEQIEQAILFAYAKTGWPKRLGGEPAVAVPANVRTFLKAQQNRVPGDVLLPKYLIDAAIRYRA